MGAWLGGLPSNHAYFRVEQSQIVVVAVIQELRIGNVEVQLEFSDKDVRIGTAEWVAWVERSLHIVTGYYWDGASVSLRDDTPLAGIRTAITQRPQ